MLKTNSIELSFKQISDQDSFPFGFLIILGRSGVHFSFYLLPDLWILLLNKEKSFRPLYYYTWIILTAHATDHV